MDPLFDAPSLGTSRQFNVMTEEERKALLTMTAMDKTGWAPESFRDGPWGIADDPQHPWRHKDVPAFLGKLGYGTVYRMPEIIDERKARALGKTWRDEVWNAFQPLNENIRRDGDLLIYILANEQVLPDHDISTLLSNAWDKTKNMPLYAPLFGQTSITEDAPEGYRDYLSHWRGTVRHDCKAEADLSSSSSSQKVDKVSWTRPLLDVKVKEPQTYNDFVARNMLALTIPWLHTKHLLNRHTLWKAIMDRSTAQPYDLSRADWAASHPARSTHLVVPPYRDGWFMGFPNYKIGTKYWTSLEEISTQTFTTDTRVHWHGLNIIDPGPKELRDPRFAALRDSGLIYPWGEGLLILQCQGVISRFMENLVPSLLEKLALSNEWPMKMLKPLMSIDPFANEAEQASLIEPGHFTPDTQERVLSLIILDDVYLRRFATKRLGWLTWDDPDYRPVGASPTSRAAAFRDYSLSLYRALAELRHNPIVFRKFFAAVMEAHPGGVPENAAAAASWEAKRNRKLRERARKKRGGAGAGDDSAAAVARVSSEAPAGGELTKIDATDDGDRVVRVLGHITSTDIDAKKSLINDVLRRGIRAMIYRLEISHAIHLLFQDFADATSKDCLELNKKFDFLADPLPGPKSRVSWNSLLAHLRRFAEILKTLLVDDGLLHSSPWIRQNFQRETCNGEWESRAAVGMSHMTPWALPTTFLPFEHRFSRNTGALQRDEQALVDDLQLLNHGDGEAAGFIGMWRVIHEMANNVGDMSERGYFESQNTRGLANTLHHVLRWSRIMEMIHPLRLSSQQYNTLLKDSRHLYFFRNLDNFDFESHVGADTMRDVQWLLGVKYADDDKPPVMIAEARKTLQSFWDDIDKWLRRTRIAPAYADGLERMRFPEKFQTPEQMKQAIIDGKSDPATTERQKWEHFRVTQICGKISTLKPREADEPAPAEPAPLPAAVIAAKETIESANKRWIMERYGGAGRHAPGRFRPSTSQSHQEHEIYRARARTRLTQTDWLTVERTFGHETGGITWHDWCKLVTHMGFQMQPMGGSIFKFTYTSASMLSNSQGQAGWSDHTTIHMQHGSGNTTLRPQVARSYATRFYASFGVTRDTIAEAYGTHADPDPAPDAEDDVEESDGERKRNRKRKKQKERFDRWLKAQPPVISGGHGAPARGLEIPMAMLDADIEDGPDDGDGAEEEATRLAALDINARMARALATREGGYLPRTKRGREEEEDYDETDDDELAESDEVDASPQENVEEECEDEETDEEERPRKRVRFSSATG
ncbi:hypothetical protein VD0002_g7395 [Verticillium dahliae]|uniref:Uncharacterized protein n=2 Tax=Verticillium dahliae TaxID=27337 RepID=G2XDM0_VERDV|nr:uncharacterized protein VDAG_08252 [Verticillium dahliae VdLs.17]KAF3347714.1 Gamma-glutamyltranspeptidase 1 [Verticillium dahliae VDG2]KAH6676203.1 hypothetical protein EV126DRAFT_165711 [Verticillium dahliae]EGY17088.1 hypothetical protein VDAG_08252 [Verticillium dahliae VdLs.17]KAH6696030.1 hypothetical protein EV126DRAFT_67275 [Verticillium dahliae]PNH31260.1 hypothetical protein BJF96_g5582 [Verticillium dahliae]